jgi:hypothetical protein
MIGAAVWFAIFPHGSRIASVLMVLFGLAILIYFLARVRFHLRRARPDLTFSPIS